MFHGVSPEHIALGGAAELIYRLSACYLEPGRSVLVASPSFGEYGRSARLRGARVRHCDVYAKGTEPTLKPFLRAVQKTRPTLVWLCHPNNPTGHAWTADALAEVAATCREHDALLVIDAAYLELSDATPKLPASAVQLFPLTKTFSVAGLRAGYAVAPPKVAQVLGRAAPPWPVSTLAAATVSWCRSRAGAAFVSETVHEVLRLRNTLQSGLRGLGFVVWEGHSSFFLTEVGDAGVFAARAKGAGFRVRDASSFGLPNCVRLAAQGQEANEKLLRWLGC
ncbi:MAG: L-threonine 3-O-phosphate decarboxylase [uncultured Truepera sp.]|uniref:L-threonine 3-O-phosphate decarboxylase n=1 Tax=uncultured Truepera sp. TaxID=543023 RepID=A0A6J4VWY5_9DEIN|nr:MAG: L-threonine 3-O-phosphate decarboxylase [uncultured Truepera sp.]